MPEAIRQGRETEFPDWVRPGFLALMIDEWEACILQAVDNLAVMAPDCRHIRKVDTGIVQFTARHNQ